MTFPDDAAAALRDLPFTYSERGWTAWSQPPVGYHAVLRSRVLGRGPDLFERATTALMSWQMHRRAGIHLVATDQVAVVGTRVQLALGLGPIALRAPCQVVYTVHEENRRGFAYGTLTGHPESGEEAFILTLGARDRVTFTVKAFSRPATLLTRLGGPLVPLVQHAVITRYLSALGQVSRS